MQAYVWILVLVRHHQPSLLRSRQLGSPSLDQNVVMVVALKQVPRFCHVWGRTLFVPEPCPRIKKICIVVPVLSECSVAQLEESAGEVGWCVLAAMLESVMLNPEREPVLRRAFDTRRQSISLGSKKKPDAPPTQVGVQWCYLEDRHRLLGHFMKGDLRSLGTLAPPGTPDAERRTTLCITIRQRCMLRHHKQI